MKKSVFVLAGVAMLALASCKKDYTCTCTDVPVLGTVNIEIQDAKKADAQEACDGAETTYQIASPGVSCALK